MELLSFLGVDDTTGEKYWVLQNTWGPNWGENGFFRMKRGVDEFGIESICETATPIIIDNQTKQILKPGFENTNTQMSYNTITTPVAQPEQRLGLLKRKDGPINISYFGKLIQ